MAKIASKLKTNFKEFYNKDFTFYITHKTLRSSDSDDYLYHWHDYFELEFVVGGKGVHVFDDVTYKLGPGSIYIVSPVDFHSIQYDPSGPLEMYNLKFDSGVISPAVFERIANATPPIIATLVAVEYRYVVSEMKRLLEEFRSHKPDAELMMRAGLERICLMILRRLETPQKSGAVRPVISEPTVKKAVSYINFHFRSQISLHAVADMLHLTPNYFGELFRKSMGISFTDYIKSMRLNYAHNLLTHSNLNISQICYESGFNTTSYFIENFKKEFGMTPTQYRLIHITKENFKKEP